MLTIENIAFSEEHFSHPESSQVSTKTSAFLVLHSNSHDTHPPGISNKGIKEKLACQILSTLYTPILEDLTNALNQFPVDPSSSLEALNTLKKSIHHAIHP